MVDLRGNEGGTASEMLLERLGRRLLGVSFGPGATPETYPDTVFCGPMACLVDETLAALARRGPGLPPRPADPVKVVP